MAWTGDALAAEAEGRPVKLIEPEEGSLVFVDILAIPAAAQNVEGAKAFISYMLRPEVSAQIARATYYQTPNTKARQVLEAADEHFHAAKLSAGMFGYVAPKAEVGKLIEDSWPRLQQGVSAPR
ncbi:Bacterial extracellular solute-binding protein [compost metagenome]